MIETIAKTEHITITKEKCGKHTLYVIYVIDIGSNKAYTAHDAFQIARRELTYCKKHNLFPEW